MRDEVKIRYQVEYEDKTSKKTLMKTIGLRRKIRKREAMKRVKPTSKPFLIKTNMSMKEAKTTIKSITTRPPHINTIK